MEEREGQIRTVFSERRAYTVLKEVYLTVFGTMK